MGTGSKNMVYTLEKVQTNYCQKVENGVSILFWKDLWLHRLNKYNIRPIMILANLLSKNV